MVGETVANRLLKLIKKNLEIDLELEKNVNLNTLGINSANYIKLVVAVEAEFGIEFNDEDLDFRKFSDLSSLIPYIESKVANN